MRSRLITDPHDPDGLPDATWAEFHPNFFPPASYGAGDRFGSASPLIEATPTIPAEAVAAENAQNSPGSVVAVTSGSGITINLLLGPRIPKKITEKGKTNNAEPGGARLPAPIRASTRAIRQ